MAGWQAKKVVKPMTDPIRDKAQNVFANNVSKETWDKVHGFGANVDKNGNPQPEKKMSSLLFGTAWGLMKNTFIAGIKDMGAKGHPSAKEVMKFLHLHDDDHDKGDHGKSDPHAGGDPHHT